MDLNVNDFKRLFAILFSGKRSAGTVCVLAMPSKANKKLADELREKDPKAPLQLPMRTTTQFFGPGEGGSLLRFLTASGYARGLHMRQALFLPDAANAKVENVMEVTHLWIDVDTRNFMDAYKLGAGEVQALCVSAMLGCEFPPTLIVNSGGGIHAYWKLGRSVLATEAERFDYAKSALAHLQRIFSADQQAINASLRLPGSFNLNYEPKRLVQFVEVDEARVYEVEDLLERVRVTRQLFGLDDASGLDPAQLDLISACERMGAQLSGRVGAASKSPEEWDRIARNLTIDGYRTQAVLTLAGRFCRMGVPVSKQIEQLTVKLGCTLPHHKVKQIVLSIAHRHNDRAPDAQVAIDVQ